MANNVKIVPFVPVRCPGCGQGKPTTTGRKGQKRYHTCQGCGVKFASWELGADAVRWPQAQDAPQPASAPPAASPLPRRVRPADRMPLL